MDANTAKYVQELQNAARTGKALDLPLETDDRVLARVTDGIYRQPASAIRELIANAYDADATSVSVLTDAPRYSRVVVRDNGNGMSAEVLLNMIQHIGGSAKRTGIGQAMGIADAHNASVSPGGRKLIGKMGIGLFSVSQLTRQFTIVTKPKNENYRYTAVVTLHHYSDEVLKGATTKTRFNTGETHLTSEIASPKEGHGTTIELGDLIPRARRVLQSQEMWGGVREPGSTGSAVTRVRPIAHSGLVDADGTTFLEKPQVPWIPKTPANTRLRYLSDVLIKAAKTNDLYAQTEHAFDYYFRMLWSLGLALPLPYVDTHPFDLREASGTRFFVLSNRSRPSAGNAGDNQASEVKVTGKQSVAEVAKIDPARDGDDFHVEIDGIRLYRPVRYDRTIGTTRALQTSLLFVGGFRPDLSKFDRAQRGGQDLAFTGYLYWTPRVVPREHNGLLVRIHGASGTLFDPTFLNYQIAERQRLKQIVAEVFVNEGLEEALNIDRESFNTSHPHYQIVLNWVHNALRQVFNKQKELESDVRAHRTAASGARSRSAVQQAGEEELRDAVGDENDTVREVVFTDDPSEAATAANSGSRVFPMRDVVVAPTTQHSGRVKEKTVQRVLLNKERAAAIVRLLDAYGLLENLSREQQSRLVKGILRIFNTGD